MQKVFVNKLVFNVQNHLLQNVLPKAKGQSSPELTLDAGEPPLYFNEVKRFLLVCQRVKVGELFCRLFCYPRGADSRCEYERRIFSQLGFLGTRERH